MLLFFNRFLCHGPWLSFHGTSMLAELDVMLEVVPTVLRETKHKRRESRDIKGDTQNFASIKRF